MLLAMSLVIALAAPVDTCKCPIKHSYHPLKKINTVQVARIKRDTLRIDTHTIREIPHIITTSHQSCKSWFRELLLPAAIVGGAWIIAKRLGHDDIHNMYTTVNNPEPKCPPCKDHKKECK